MTKDRLTKALLTVKVQPRAAHDEIIGWDADVGLLLIKVHALPDKGKANKAVETLLARVTGVPKTTVRVISGKTARIKTIQFETLEKEDLRNHFKGA